MTIQSLQLKHFRNFTDLTLQFDAGFNFFFGQNAQGKTNIIEAIHYLADLKSFRSSDKNDLIQHGAEFAHLKAHIEKDGLTSAIDITLNPNHKTVLVNGKKPKSQKDYAELLPLLLFEPRHIYLLRDSPSERRKYLNRSLYLQDPTTLPLMRDYDKIIAQKNKILKDPHMQNGFSQIHLDAWNDRLVQLGAEIMHRRLDWFAQISTHLAAEYKALSGTSETLRFVYQPAVALSTGTQVISTQDIQQQFFKTLQDKQHEELYRREAFIGPHRDDFHAFLDERDVATYGSQGENRSVVIALKLAQLKLFFQKFGKMPLFLLDDVASELDAKRCEYLFAYLRDESVQAFLTTTENDRITTEFLGKSLCYQVRGGICQVV